METKSSTLFRPIIFALIFSLFLIVAFCAFLPLPSASGPIALSLTISSESPFTEVPLVVTGRNYAGDFLTLAQLPDGRFQVGYNSFGFGGPKSNPFSLREGRHTFLIDLPSLYDPFERALRSTADTSKLYVSINGDPLIEENVHYFHASKSTIYLGKNPFGKWVGLGGSESIPTALGAEFSISTVITKNTLSLGTRIYFQLHSHWRYWITLLVLFPITVHIFCLRRLQIYSPGSVDILSAASVFLAATQLYPFIAAQGTPFATGHRFPPGFSELYSYLTDGFIAGQTHLPQLPSAELLNLSNPYDPQQNGPFRLHDALLFNSRFYLYHSATPALLFNAPWQLAFDSHLPQNLATAILLLLCLTVLLTIFLLYKVRFFPAANPFITALGMLSLAATPQVFHVLARASFYEQAIAAASLFLAVASLGALIRLTHPHVRSWPEVISGTGIALAVSCRPNLLPLIALFIMFFVFVPRSLAMDSSGGRKHLLINWQRIIGLIVPILAVGCGYMSYNYARFGSPLEIGVKWLLWAGTRPFYETVSAAPLNIFPHLAAYLFELPKFECSFPFFRPDSSPILPLSRLNFGFEPIVGLIPSQPLLILTLTTLPLAMSRILPRARIFVLFLFFCFLLPFLVNCSFSGIAMRYMLDFQPALNLFSATWIIALSQTIKSRPVRFIFHILIAIALAYSTTLGIAMGFNSSENRFRNDNPALLDYISEIFSLAGC